MNYKLKNLLIGFFLFIGFSAILKFYFETPNSAILFLFGLGLIAGLTTILVLGFFNPPSWLYGIRFSFVGIFYGIFMGIMLFGMESIEENSFIIQDLLQIILVSAIIGGLISNFIMYSHSQIRKRRKGLFLLERPLVIDFARLTKQSGEKLKGKLVLTNDHLIFFGNGNEDKTMEKEICEIRPVVNKMKFLRIPNGIRIERDEILLTVPFPYYWIKRINKRKRIKATEKQTGIKEVGNSHSRINRD